ncbi:MAG: IS66 family transposase [Candidatus Jacksonbacteria bacterium]|nr:IS66 family transposase [Candidatus Jacksonbacteria bacterium]
MSSVSTPSYEEIIATQQEQIQLLLDTVESYQKRCEQYQQAYESMAFQVKELLRDRFGKRSERDVDPMSPQLDLFSSLALPENSSDSKEETSLEIASHRRKKKSKDTSQYPRIIEVIELPEAEKTCDCGCQRKLLRYETKELYHHQPAEFYILEQRREVMACPKGCEQSLKTAPAPLQVLPKVKATEGLLANVVVSKVHHRQPLYHLEKYMAAVNVSRETMARWFIQLAPPLQPLLNLMKDEVLNYDIAGFDATTLQVLNEPGRRAETKSYVYCTRGGPPDKSVILYDYQHKQHKTYIQEWFAGFEGSIHLDAAPVFDLLLEEKAIHSATCNAHARRYFEKVKQQAKKQGLAHEAMRYYKKLFRIERQAKEQSLSAQQRHALRQKESAPLLKEMKQWLDAHAPSALPKSPLAKAFNYCIKHWQGLTHFLTDGRIEIDNNGTEREIKPLVIARKNFMFAQSTAGAKALCTHFSLVRTALAHGLDPYHYYVHILKQLPHCQTVEDYEQLLPWHVTLENCVSQPM